MVAYAPEAHPPWAGKANVLSVERWGQNFTKYTVFYHKKQAFPMLKKICGLTLVALMALVILVPALAADYGLTETSGAIGYGSDTGNIYTLINRVITIFLSMLAILFFGLMLYAGIRWMTSRGNEELATKAKETIEAAVLGLIVVILAYALVNFIFQRLGA